MKTDLSFKIYGEPRPQARPRLTGKRVYSPKSEWRTLVQVASIAERLRRNNKTFSGPLMVHLSYYFKRPKNHYRLGKFSTELKFDAPVYCNNGYDLDNLNKAVLDALTDSSLILDDRIIVELSSKKCWEDNYMDSGIIITIVRLKGKKNGKEHQEV